MASLCLNSQGVSDILFPPKEPISVLVTVTESLNGEAELKSEEGTMVLTWEIPSSVLAGRTPGEEGRKQDLESEFQVVPIVC